MPTEELPQKVLLSVFDKPLNITEIGIKIYKKKRQTYPKLMGKTGAIQKCLDRNWIKQVWLELPDKKKPHSFELMKYLYADIDPILKEINNELSYRNKELTHDEKDKLEEILDSDSFRGVIGIASDKVDYNRNVDTFDIVMELLSVLGAFALVCKNYGLYLTKKHKKHLPKKYRKMDISRLGKKEYDELKKEYEKKGMKLDSLIDESLGLLAQLLPPRIKTTTSEEVKLSKELGTEIMSLSPELCEKLSSLASYYADFFVTLIGMSFVVPEETNTKSMEQLASVNARLIEFLKKHGFRIPKA
jgi:hypothetical protein